VLDVIAKTSFSLDAESEALSNDTDDHTRMVFAPDLRGNTDRYLLRMRKPGE
jgi:predicted methyltransferase